MKLSKYLFVLPLVLLLQNTKAQTKIDSLYITSLSNDSIGVQFHISDAYQSPLLDYSHGISNDTLFMDLCFIPSAAPAISGLDTLVYAPLDPSIKDYVLFARIFFTTNPDSCDYNAISDSAYLNFSAPLGLLENLDGDNILVFPNPAKDLVYLTWTNIEIQHIQIINALGQKLRSIHNNFEIINLEDLPTGIYYLNIETSKGNFSKKILH